MKAINNFKELINSYDNSCLLLEDSILICQENLNELKEAIKESELSNLILTDEGNLSHSDYCHDVCGIIWHSHLEEAPDEIVFDEINEEYILLDEAVYGYFHQGCRGYFSYSENHHSYCGEYYHEDTLNYHSLVLDGDGDVLHLDDACYCEDVGEYYHYDYCYYCEESEEHYRYSENMPSNNKTAHRICGYHDSPEAKDLSNNSIFKIGFEIEKTDFFGYCSKGCEIGEYNIFKGFEVDSSCGVEAITNILALTSDSSYFERLCNEAKEVINSDYDENCGGHITLSIQGMTGEELFDIVKPYLGIFYAMYRYRLNNTFCNSNKALKEKRTHKYSSVNIKSNCIEIRIPNAVKNVNQLLFRYRMSYHLLLASYFNIGFEQYLDNCQNLLKPIYKDSLNKINRLSNFFQEYINEEIISSEIEQFIKD